MTATATAIFPRVNSIVSLPASSSYGVVTEIFQHGNRTLAAVHYIDPNTGELLECPDKARCNHARTCPIHGRNVDVSELNGWNTTDVAFYVAQGMVSERIGRLAACATLHIERRGSHKYKISAAKNGMICNTITLTPQEGNPDEELWLCVSLCNVADDFRRATLIDPDADDYKKLEALFATTALGPIN